MPEFLLYKDNSSGTVRAPLGLRNWLCLLLITFLGLGLRLYCLNASEFRLDADEAIVGLMAKHIVEGREVPVFYYGQHYMGSLESLLIAAAFWLCGISSEMVKLIPLLFSVCLIPLMFALVSELANRRAGWFAALVTAAPPSALVVWGSMARGGFIEVIVIGVLALLSLVVFVKDAQRKTYLLFLAGLFCGLGWWVNNQIVYFMLPIGLFCLLMARREATPFRAVIRWGLLGMGGFFVGGIAYWFYNFRNDFVSFKMLSAAGGGDSISRHLSGFLFESLPILLGARRFWQVEDLFPFAFVVSLLLYGSLFLVWLWSQRLALLALLKGQVSQRSLQLLLGFFLLAVVAVFAGSSFGHLSVAPRYVLPLYVGIFAIAGIALDRMAVFSRAGAALCISGLLSFNILSSFWHGVYVPGEPVVVNRNRVQKNHQEIIALLHQLDIKWVKTDYWIGNRLAFETQERVKPLPFGEHKDCRVPEYCERAKDIEANRLVPYLLVPDQVGVVVTGLRLQGVKFKIAKASGYTLVYDLVAKDDRYVPLRLEGAVISTSHNLENASLALDGSVDTHWSTRGRQSPGMYYKVSFSSPQRISGLRYSLGKVPHDYPRKLQVSVTLKDGTEVPVLDSSDYNAVRYLLNGDGEFKFVFKQQEVTALTLSQVGHDSVFDWSLAELTFFRRMPHRYGR